MKSDKMEMKKENYPKDIWEKLYDEKKFAKDNYFTNNYFPSYNNNNNNVTNNNLRMSPQKQILNYLKEIGCEILGTYFSDLKYKSPKDLKRLLKAFKKDPIFWDEMFSELEATECGTITQFLRMIEVNDENFRYDKKYRLRVERVFQILKRLKIMFYESIDPKTHPDIMRHLNATKFWYLKGYDDDKYAIRFQEAIDNYIFAKSTLGKSAYADKQRIDEANGNKKPEPEVSKYQQELQDKKAAGGKNIYTCKLCDKLFEPIRGNATLIHKTHELDAMKQYQLMTCHTCWKKSIEMESK